MLDGWMDLPAWLRLVSALIVLVSGALVVMFVHVRLGLLLCGLGFGMIMVGGKSDSERNGYRF